MREPGRHRPQLRRRPPGSDGPRRSGLGSEEEPREEISYPPGFAVTEADRRGLVALLGLPSLTARRLGRLAGTHPTAGACLAAARRGEAVSDADAARARAVDIDRAWQEVEACGARLVAVGDLEYPEEVLNLRDPPAGLFVRGEDLSGLTPRVAIVGARNCSAQGREVAEEIGAGLATAGVCVVSGGARGIDGAAHAGALRVPGGRTIAVLGCGIDTIYPRENRRMIEQILRRGAVVSEYPPGTPAEPFRFPARNRIVAALSCAVVVVEGALGSGSMITVEHALEIGREVFAVPGAVTSALAAVPLQLMRDGARMVRGSQDLIEDLGWSPAREAGADHEASRAPPPTPPGLSIDEQHVWRVLGASSTPDGLAALTALPLPAVLSALARLEIRGLIREVGGRYEPRLRAEHP